LNSNDILSIHEDKKGNLWLGTYGGGLNRLNLSSGVITKYLDVDGLPNNSVYGILQDHSGCLWISTNGGLCRFDPESRRFQNFFRGDGLQASEFNQGAYCAGPSGKMYFGGINGFNVFHPDNIRFNTHQPPVVITGIQVLNKNVPSMKSISTMRELTLSHKEYFFSFEFAALDYHQPLKNRYQYILEGFRKEWIFTDAKKPLAQFTNLNPGSYVFRVKGTNNDGVWNEEGVSISLTITPPVWKTWWFRVLMVVVFALLSYWGIGLIKKYLYLIRFWEKHVYVGNFRLLHKIASGGMGTVYKAQNLSDKTEIVALKILRDELFTDELNRKRFKQEGAIIDQLDHPNIVKVIERGEHKQKLYLAMELLEGRNLSEFINQESPIPVPLMLEMMIQISRALKKIHARRIVHRDLKPANIMVISTPLNSNMIKLLDFGLAKMDFQSRITQTGMVMGTIDYMSPEQVRYSEFSTASDVYSLGIIFYEMVTGTKPFKGETSAQIMKYILNSDPIPPIQIRSDIPVNLDNLIKKMISKDDKKRPAVVDILEILKMMKRDLESC
jgi:tRNA A-37 threonylcarbamoyl transferase component Bud32